MDPFARLDRQGCVIPMEKWILLQQSDDYRFVRSTRAAETAWVITLWDGFDPYGFLRKGEPLLIFETTVFEPTGSQGLSLNEEGTKWRATQHQQRHATESAALEYHEQQVTRLRDQT